LKLLDRVKKDEVSLNFNGKHDKTLRTNKKSSFDQNSNVLFYLLWFNYFYPRPKGLFCKMAFDWDKITFKG